MAKAAARDVERLARGARVSRRLLIASAVLAPSWSAALAQENGDTRVRVGLGAKLQPEFIGADSTEVAPLWDLDIARGTNPFRFESPDDSFGIDVISEGGFALGPAAKIESSRKDSEVGVPLGKVPTTIEVGGFAQYDASESIRLRSEVRKGIGGHDGLVGQIGADHIWRDGDRYVLSVGPRVLFSNGRYQRAYFGVTPEAALATGLPAYDPGGGVHAVAAAGGMSYQFNNRFGTFGFARFERLVGDAADSPVVRELGSRNQMSAGLGLSYTFTIRR